MTLTREQFENAPEFVTRKVDVGMGEDACIRTIPAKERDAYHESINDGKRTNLVNMSARLVARCLCDDEGVLLYPDANEGAAIIGEWDGGRVDSLYRECMKLNRMRDTDIEEAAKNCETTLEDSSSTD